jgi:hypothetical protein
MPEHVLWVRQSQWPVKLSIEVTSVKGEGGVLSPRLVVLLKLDFASGWHQTTEPDFAIFGAFGTISFIDPVQRLADLIPCVEPQHVMNGFMRTYSLEFPLDQRGLDWIENRRHGDVGLRIDIRFHIGAHELVRSGQGIALSARISFENLPAQFDLQVPQSHWVNQVLPGLGYGEVRVVEIPLSSPESIPDFPHAVDELLAAQRYFRTGDNDKAVAHCRSALEHIYNNRQELAKRETSESLADWFKTVVQKTWPLVNKPHHPPSMGHFSRADAQMIYSVTTEILAYVGRLLEVRGEVDQ